MTKIKQKKRIEEFFKYPNLRHKMGVYEDLYFQDMTFNKKSILNKLTKVYYQRGGKIVAYIHDICGDNPAEFMLNDDWLIVYDEGKYVLEGNVEGRCDSQNKTIIIKKCIIVKEYEKNIILHEMIHAYESILPERFQQFLTLYFYDFLIKKIGYKKLWKFLYRDNHILDRVHTPLFLLKSLELDLRLRYTLGTIYGYGREELLK